MLGPTSSSSSSPRMWRTLWDILRLSVRTSRLDACSSVPRLPCAPRSRSPRMESPSNSPERPAPPILIVSAISAIRRSPLFSRASSSRSAVGARAPRALVGSFAGMFRGSWRRSVEWYGLVSCPVGVVLSPGSIAAHAGRSQSFEVEDSPSRLLHDLGDTKTVRGSLDFAQWRVSAWEVIAADSDAHIPAGSTPKLFSERL